MLFDTDMLIWVQRGHKRAADLIDAAAERHISIQTHMELLQSAANKQQHRLIKRYLSDMGFTSLPLSPNIGYRALVYIEEYSLSSGLRAGDAIIAATATENGLTLCTSNEKHYRVIKDLDLKTFKPAA